MTDFISAILSGLAALSPVLVPVAVYRLLERRRVEPRCRVRAEGYWQF